MSNPLVTDDADSILIKKILAEIAQPQHINGEKNKNCGLLNGLSGELLWLFRLSQYDSCLVDESLFIEKLDFLQSQLPFYSQNPNVVSGLCGQGWFLEYLNQHQQEDYDPLLYIDIDEQLHQALCDPSFEGWHGEIEMIMGLAGVSIYAARRNQHHHCEKHLRTLLAYFENLAIRCEANSISWSQPKKSKYRYHPENKHEFNLGLAHGVPGIMAALLPMLKITDLKERATSLLLQSSNWLLNQQQPRKNNLSYFGYIADTEKNSRLGWCYGDLPIALTLARIGIALNKPQYMSKAKEIALDCAQRNMQQGSVGDAGLCHGSAGLVLMFLQLNKLLDEPVMLSAANHWLQHTLELYRKQGLKGFNAFYDKEMGFQLDSGFLMGYSGIGLCLLSALGEPTDWIDCLLLA